MRKPRSPRQGWAKVSLGLSLLFAVGAFVYLSLAGSPASGTGLAIVVIVAGIWEYRRRRQDEITSERYEAEAEDRQRRYRR
jgi:hypothetical protein